MKVGIEDKWWKITTSQIDKPLWFERASVPLQVLQMQRLMLSLLSVQVDVLVWLQPLVVAICFAISSFSLIWRITNSGYSSNWLSLMIALENIHWMICLKQFHFLHIYLYGIQLLITKDGSWFRLTLWLSLQGHKDVHVKVLMPCLSNYISTAL